MQGLNFNRIYFFDSSTETFLKSLNSLLNSKADFLALVPAALFPFSDCWLASFENASNSALIFSISSFIT